MSFLMAARAARVGRGGLGRGCAAAATILAAALFSVSCGTSSSAVKQNHSAFVSLPDAMKAGTASLIAWIAQTFLQLVLLSIIMVGQKVAASASDKQAFQTYKDAEALLEISNDVQRLLKQNTELTQQIHKLVEKGAPA